MKARRITLVLLVVMLSLLITSVAYAKGVGQGSGFEGASLTPVVIQTIAGIILSLAFSYIPKLKAWFNSLGQSDPEDNGARKRLVMLGLLAVVWAAMIGLDYFGFIPMGLVYDKQGWVVNAFALISAIISNQTAYSITPMKGPAKTTGVG